MATGPAIWDYLLPSPALATSMKTMGPAAGQSDGGVKKWGRAFNYICRAAGSKAVSTEYMYSATVETD